MRVVVLTTGTNNTKPLYEPLIGLGHQITVVVYDDMPTHEQLPEIVAGAKPDVVLLIGAIEEHHGKPVPKVDTFGKIGAKHLLAHLCCDGGEPAWWAQLQRYYDDGNFALQINIDGVRVGPIGDRGMTMLCPIDPGQFPDPPRPWFERTLECGFGGGLHGGHRAATVHELIRRGALAYRPRDADGYKGYREFLCSSRVTLNYPATGGGTPRQHVKARVIEAAVAGSLVLELAGAPTDMWFKPGEDYLTYRTVEEAQERLAWVRANPTDAACMALRLREKVTTAHSPAVFWAQVFERLGFGPSKIPLRQVPFQHWNMAELGGAPHDNQPHLMETSKNGNNLVKFRGRHFVIPQSIGPIDISLNNGDKHPAIRVYDDLAQARAVL